MKKLLFLALFTLNLVAQEHTQVFVSSDGLEVPISQTLANKSKTIRNLLDVAEGQSINLSEHDLRIPIDFTAAAIKWLQDILDNPDLLQRIPYKQFLAIIKLWDFLDIQDIDSLNLNSLLESLFETGNYKVGDLPDNLIIWFKENNPSFLWQYGAFKTKKISLKDLKLTDYLVKDISVINYASLSPNGKYAFFTMGKADERVGVAFFIMDLTAEKLVFKETGAIGIASPDGSILIKYNTSTIDIIDTNTLEIIKQLTCENISDSYLPPVAVFYKDNVVKLLRGTDRYYNRVIIDSINLTTHEVKETTLIDSSRRTEGALITAGAFSADGSQVLLSIGSFQGPPHLLLKEIDSKKTLWEIPRSLVGEIITNNTCVAMTRGLHHNGYDLRNLLNGEVISIANLPPCVFASNNPLAFFYMDEIVLVDIRTKKIIKKFPIEVWPSNRGMFTNDSSILQMDVDKLIVYQLDTSLLQKSNIFMKKALLAAAGIAAAAAVYYTWFNREK